MSKKDGGHAGILSFSTAESGAHTMLRLWVSGALCAHLVFRTVEDSRALELIAEALQDVADTMLAEREKGESDE